MRRTAPQVSLVPLSGLCFVAPLVLCSGLILAEVEPNQRSWISDAFYGREARPMARKSACAPHPNWIVPVERRLEICAWSLAPDLCNDNYSFPLATIRIHR